jgi:hypothetical protein
MRKHVENFFKKRTTSTLECQLVKDLNEIVQSKEETLVGSLVDCRIFEAAMRGMREINHAHVNKIVKIQRRVGGGRRSYGCSSRPDRCRRGPRRRGFGSIEQRGGGQLLDGWNVFFGLDGGAVEDEGAAGAYDAVTGEGPLPSPETTLVYEMDRKNS